MAGGECLDWRRRESHLTDRNSKRLKRIAVYLLLGLPFFAWSTTLGLDPDRDLGLVVAAAVESKGDQLLFQEGAAYLALDPGQGYVLTLCVRGIPRYQSVEFFTLIRKPSGDLRVELMIPQGRTFRQVALEGPAAIDYLEKVALDHAPLTEVYETYYGPAPVAKKG